MMENQNDYIKKVQESYVPQERTKLDELKELDKKVKRFPKVFSCLFGVIAALVLGVGMCLAMNVIGTSYMSPTVLTAVGVVIGCVGILLCIVNYFIYHAILKSRKKKYGSQIISLGNELLNQDN